MSTSPIFGFTIDETDGNLVITLSGALAVEAARNLRQQIEGGQASTLLRRFAPLHALPQLLLSSAPVTMVPDKAGERKEAEAPLTMQQIFSQGFDGGLDQFESQLKAFQSSLDELENELEKT